MKFFAVLLIALVCIGDISAVSLRKSQAASREDTFKKLRQLSNKGDFAKRFVSNIQLSLSTGDAVDDVIATIDQALTDQRVSHGNLISERDSTLEGIASDVHRIQGEINADNAELQLVLQRIEELNEQIATLTDKVNLLTQELADLAERRTTVVDAREADIIAFGKRQERDQRAIDALEEIIPELEALAAGGDSLLQKSQAEIVKALEKVPKDNRVSAFVQLSTKLNPAKLQFVVAKLKEIKQAITVSKADDEEKEAESAIKYTALLAEIDAVVSKKTTEKQENNRLLRAAVSNEAKKQVEKQGLKDNIDINTGLHSSMVTHFDNTQENYNNKVKSSQDAIDALEMCLQILREGEENLHTSNSVAEQATAAIAANGA